MPDQRSNLEDLLKETEACRRDFHDKDVADKKQIENLPTLLYTASETGMLGDIDSIDVETAKRIWLLVEASRMLTPNEMASIRM